LRNQFEGKEGSFSEKEVSTFVLFKTSPRIGWVNGPNQLCFMEGRKKNEGERGEKQLELVSSQRILRRAKQILMVSDEMSQEINDYIGRTKAQQEMLNGRMKGTFTFNVLGHRFRHNQKSAEKTMKLHQTDVHACTVLIQYDCENGHPPFPLH
jgi:hypothetical protein